MSLRKQHKRCQMVQDWEYHSKSHDVVLEWTFSGYWKFTSVIKHSLGLEYFALCELHPHGNREWVIKVKLNPYSEFQEESKFEGDLDAAITKAVSMASLLSGLKDQVFRTELDEKIERLREEDRRRELEENKREEEKRRLISQERKIQIDGVVFQEIKVERDGYWEGRFLEEETWDFDFIDRKKTHHFRVEKVDHSFNLEATADWLLFELSEDTAGNTEWDCIYEIDQLEDAIDAVKDHFKESDRKHKEFCDKQKREKELYWDKDAESSAILEQIDEEIEHVQQLDAGGEIDTSIDYDAPDDN